MSSARVRQKTRFDPARPNAVRQPSTNTTSRSARAIGASLLGAGHGGGEPPTAAADVDRGQPVCTRADAVDEPVRATGPGADRGAIDAGQPATAYAIDVERRRPSVSVCPA